MHKVGFGRERKVCTMDEIHAEPPFPYDYVTSRNGNCKRVLISTAESKLNIFVPILTDIFNHWVTQGAIPGSVTKGVITLLKKGCWHVWEGLEDYRPITLLNTELKILARVLANRLQLVISDLIGPERAYVVKGWSIQDNLHLIREVLEEIEDGTEAAVINLDQSKAFDRIDHRFLASVLETTGFKPEFRRWISMMYRNPQAVVQVNGRRSWEFVGVHDWVICPAGLPPVSASLCPRFGDHAPKA